jgi:osmoprotectant transport system substrate-binding protein
MKLPSGAPLVRGVFSLALITVTMASCTVGMGGVERPEQNVPPRSDNIVIGAFNFSESRVLAEVYRQALESNGFATDVLSDVGPREVIEPALEQDQIDVAVEYLGASLAFLDPEALESVVSPAHAYRLLESAFAAKGVRTFSPAPGQNRNEFVVTAQTAEENDLQTLSDLQEIDSDIVFGGPPECVARPLCMEGLERIYQLEFASFIPLDSGGPQSVAALEAGEVDLALLFTTNPAISEERLVALKDDRHLQPPENILPVARSEVVAEHGGDFVETLDDVTRLLTTAELRALNADVEISQRSPEDAARDWLAEQDIT